MVGGGLQAPAPFKIYFKNGGAQTFVSLFFPLHEVVKQHYADASREFQAQQRIMLQRQRAFRGRFCLSVFLHFLVSPFRFLARVRLIGV